VPHPKEALLEELYGRFGKGDMQGVLEMCTDDIVFHVPGNTPFSGDHTKADFISGWIQKVMELSGGTFGERAVIFIANDDHGIAVLDHWLERDGKRIDYRVDHIWRFRGDKCCEWTERPGSEAEFERAWA